MATYIYYQTVDHDNPPDPTHLKGELRLCPSLHELLIAADSELSAIAHGRPQSEKAELLRISAGLRKAYERLGDDV